MHLHEHVLTDGEVVANGVLCECVHVCMRVCVHTHNVILGAYHKPPTSGLGPLTQYSDYNTFGKRSHNRQFHRGYNTTTIQVQHTLTTCHTTPTFQALASGVR